MFSIASYANPDFALDAHTSASAELICQNISNVHRLVLPHKAQSSFCFFHSRQFCTYVADYLFSARGGRKEWGGGDIL
jgi:hypothetical protein